MTYLSTELGSALRALGEHGERLLAFAAAPEQLDEIGEGLDRARRLLTDARAELGPSGCRLHPTAPVDPAAGGGCLFCATNRRRGLAAAAVVEEAPTSVICRAVVEQGHEAAVARYGARAVTRAILTCRNNPEFLEESA
ncbi:hypothetical protein [Streptomyces sp. NBC_00425]|uniref:hypothetical protein n=1 Tax=Streptomyces sp. NBC_00425 TaxID=2975740 RepID=UPI002E22D59D